MAHTDAAEGAVAATAPQRDAVATRRRILDAAEGEFAEKGLGGTRIAAIAERAGCNKALIYHYFAGKDELFAAVLERTYHRIRSAEQALDLEHLPPETAMRRLVEFSFDYVQRNPSFIKLLNEENLHGAVHLRDTGDARRLTTPLVAVIRRILDRGERQGVFRAGVDPVQLYITIASVAYFFTANRATLSEIFDLPRTPDVARARRGHIVEVVLGYLRPGAGDRETLS
ncbi:MULTISPECIES: TetR/AcrR family transcriptional regulator [unclassified Roseitalea]|uniref:TetR/AcrR family transcriptional regulator n=1 Tax=unclassified Roseitalea TaxID=2639107 RepID=UPI00273EFFFA|nr:MULTISPECIES: TetR/AcrR family transcriptional regulator [unclassified Roseitalea]